MSIYKAYQTPVRLLRSFFFSIVTICSILIIFPMEVFAVETGTLGDVDDTKREEVSSPAVFSQNIYHKHTGSSKGGGCYTVKKTGTKTEEVPCEGSMIYWPDLGTTSCSKCGASYFGDQSHRGCWYYDTVETTYTYYERGCKKTTSTLLGTVYVTQSTTDWTKSLLLTASYEAVGGMVVSDCPFIWNKEEAVAENTYEVNGNGEYTLQLNADRNADTATAMVTVSIKNIDVTAPVVDSYVIWPREEWTKEGVLVTFDEIRDLQPDGSEGCGLHETAYSYDSGQSWTSKNTYLFDENGTHTVLIRDQLENTVSCQIAFSNIDRTPPTITGIEYDDADNIRSVTLSVSANDLQSDGSEGCGLHETPYSFDGGVTWSEKDTWQADSNGSIVVAVRDKLDNIAYQEVNVTNIDCYAPVISYEMVQDSWTNQDVKLYLHAEDKNADGSDGVGLADNWYSLDGGRTWMNADVLFYESNQEVSILARDKNDNRTRMDISILQIDKDLPWVSLGMEVSGEGKDMQVVLTAYGEDDYSGLPEDAYSWDKGGSYGKEQTKVITENGLYQVRVRDKAGNWNSDNIEVDVFLKEETEPPVMKETVEEETEPPVIVGEAVEVIEIEEETTQEVEREEVIPEPVVVKAKKLEEKPKTKEITAIEEQGWGAKEWLVFSLITVVAIALLLLLLVLLRTIAVFAEDEHGKMQFIGLQWIHCKEERYEVRFSEMLLEQCVTTHFALCPGVLFVLLHKDAQICCLFPEDICLTLSVEKEIDFSLL